VAVCTKTLIIRKISNARDSLLQHVANDESTHNFLKIIPFKYPKFCGDII
jgi:hypothetical protein